MQALALAAEAIRATTGRLAKRDALAAYLLRLDLERLPSAVRYFAGRVFPTGDPRSLGAGGATLAMALQEVSGAGPAAMSDAWRRHRDAGEAAYELLSTSDRAEEDAVGGGLDLLAVARALGDIAEAGSGRERTDGLRNLLRACTPLEAKYVVKLVTGDMRIGLREGLVEEAIGVAFGRDAAAVARADMLVGDLGEVALLAARDRLAAAAPRLYSPLRYMLASPVADAEEAVRRLGTTVWVEDKYDGIRCQLHRGRDRVALFSRDLREVTAQFPEVEAAAAELPAGLILNGEILAFREGSVLPFSALQRRLGRVRPDPAILAEVPVIHVAWDLLLDSGSSCLDLPLRERRRRLDGLGLGGALATAHLATAAGARALDACFEDARARLNEGLMVKDPDSPYTPGRRGLHWLKLKRPLDALDVVVVGAEWGHGRRRNVLSDVTFALRRDGSDDLAPIGKAYTGLTDAEIAEMTRLLLELTTAERGGYRAVRPAIVLEVAFDAVQRSSRHGSGFALRFPRIARWRHDKGPAEIDVLSRLETLAAVRDRPRDQRVDQAPR